VRVLQTTQRWDRRSIRIGWGGITAVIERPKVGGGWYIAQRLDVPWPFRKEPADA
jgi:hypothetical protein